MKIPILVVSVLVVVLCGGCTCGSRGSAAQGTSAGLAYKKGVEFYSWQERGEWLFALLDVTNIAKPEQEIKAVSVKLAELPGCFARYPEGERVFWYIAQFSRPDPATIRQVELAAQKHKLNLSLVE